MTLPTSIVLVAVAVGVLVTLVIWAFVVVVKDLIALALPDDFEGKDKDDA